MRKDNPIYFVKTQGLNLPYTLDFLCLGHERFKKLIL